MQGPGTRDQGTETALVPSCPRCGGLNVVPNICVRGFVMAWDCCDCIMWFDHPLDREPVPVGLIDRV
jgi:hypothetical protein